MNLMEADGSSKILVSVYLNLQCHILRTPQASYSSQQENQILSVENMAVTSGRRLSLIHKEKKKIKCEVIRYLKIALKNSSHSDGYKDFYLLGYNRMLSASYWFLAWLTLQP
jgi:hypothetical protein